jgi:tRNA pseudouridine38-40 synthase
MRVALKIAYDGRTFYGHQRQPDARTVEGECLAALRAARILSDPAKSFFRSASRTDRGVSAIGNVIAFHAELPPEAVLGAFNDKARDVWAWAYAPVPDSFHPRHADERWYRYHLLEPPDLDRLRGAAKPFEGQHEFRWFTSDPPAGPFVLRRVEVTGEDGAATIDVRARSFRRGMVRRIVAAMLAFAKGDVELDEIVAALAGVRYDFGMAPAEPLVLMDVRYGFEFTTLLKPKVLEEWGRIRTDLSLRLRLLRDLQDAAPRPVARPRSRGAQGPVS